MPRRDLKSNLDGIVSIVPVVATSTKTGTHADLLGYDGAIVEFLTGALAGAGLITWKIQEGNLADDSDMADVAAADLQLDAVMAALTALALTASMWGRVGYVGRKRYIRPVLTYVSGTSLAVAASVIRGFPNQRPLA